MRRHNADGTPQSNPVVQSPTTPGQFYMGKNADIPRSDVHPPLIDPSLREPTTPGLFDMWKNAIEKADYSQMYPCQMYPP